MPSFLNISHSFEPLEEQRAAVGLANSAVQGIILKTFFLNFHILIPAPVTPYAWQMWTHPHSKIYLFLNLSMKSGLDIMRRIGYVFEL